MASGSEDVFASLSTPRGLSEKAQNQFDQMLDALVDLFKRIDSQNKGSVHKDEAKKWFDSLFPDEDPSQASPDDPLEIMFRKLDSDQDNQVTLKDWIQYWHRRLSKNFQRSGELKLSDEELDRFLVSIRAGHRP